MKRTLSEVDLSKVRDAALLIESNLKIHLTISDLAAKVCLNDFKLKLGFKQLYGMGPFSYLQLQRIHKARQMLRQGYNNKHVAISLGFSGLQAENSFIKYFKKHMAISPGAWKAEQARKKEEGVVAEISN